MAGPTLYHMRKLLPCHSLSPSLSVRVYVCTDNSDPAMRQETAESRKNAGVGGYGLIDRMPVEFIGIY